MQYWFCLNTSSSGELVLQWEAAQVFQRDVGWWGESLGPESGDTTALGTFDLKNSLKDRLLSCTPGFHWDLETQYSHWLLSAVVELCLFLGQDLEMRSNCLLCCSPSLLSRISGHFWLSACDFFPAQISHPTKVTGRWRGFLFLWLHNASRLQTLMTITEESCTKTQMGEKGH